MNAITFFEAQRIQVGLVGATQRIVGSEKGAVGTKAVPVDKAMRFLKGIGLIVLVVAVSTAAVRAAQPDNNEKLQSYLAAARQAAARSDFSAAADSYRKAVEASPQTAEVWTNLGLMYHQASSESHISAQTSHSDSGGKN